MICICIILAQADQIDTVAASICSQIRGMYNDDIEEIKGDIIYVKVVVQELVKAYMETVADDVRPVIFSIFILLQ